MKKLLTLIFLLPYFVFAQFTWGGLANNQFVSALDAQGSGIAQLNTLPSTYRWLTKSDCIYYLSVNASETTFATYASNQYVPKSVIWDARVAPVYYTYIVSGTSETSSADACTYFTPSDAENYILYAADATPTTSTVFYTNTALTTQADLTWSKWYGLCLQSDQTTVYSGLVNGESGYIFDTVNTCTNYADDFDPVGVWVSSSAQSATITVTAGANTYDLACDDTWFTVSVGQVTGSTTFNINFSENTSGTERISQVSVTIGGNWAVGIQVRQDAAP